MGIKRSAFASRSERENYYKLSRSWGQKFRIYHNLPFLNIFTTDDLSNIEQYEVNRLKKTSVDFVLCNDLDEFILCIDFDGWLQGVNQGKQYQPTRPARDSWRKEINELKLYVAHESKFPYFILSSEEFKDMSPSLPITIADGLIGNVVANKVAQERKLEFKGPRGISLNEEEASILKTARFMGNVNWELLFEVAAEAEHNPIVRLRWETWDELGRPLFETFFSGFLPFDKLISHPALSKYATIFPEGLPAGNTVIINSDAHGSIWANVNLHNFETPGYSGFWLGEDIAHLLALDKFRRVQKSTK